MKTQKTLVGNVDAAVLAFTAGKDVTLDLAIAEADCIGTAAHVTMLARMPDADILTPDAAKTVITELVQIIRRVRKGTFRIEAADQDVHLAVERLLTRKLGDAGKRIHTGRSRNDQVAVDLRLYGKTALLDVMEQSLLLAQALTAFGKRHARVPMVGRTHLQPAMPSSVGLWATAHAESLLDDMSMLSAAYEVNNKCPLGSAAGYGVPLPIDRALTARLLGFHGPHLNVSYASQSRGKCESIVLAGLAQAMETVSRLAEDLILFGMPEFGYFLLPPEFGTGSSIMPQKNNPDVLELTRARARKVAGYAAIVASIVQGLPSGYSRDLQETKEPFIEGLGLTLGCVGILTKLVAGIKVDRKRLLAGFTPEVFAAGRALELVAGGMPFRDAYDHVKAHLGELAQVDPAQVAKAQAADGSSCAVDYRELGELIKDWLEAVRDERRDFHAAVSKLLGVKYPALP